MTLVNLIGVLAAVCSMASFVPQIVKIWRAQADSRPGAPGEVLERGVDGILIGCGEGALRVTELQRAGGTRLAVADFLHGFQVSRGERFGTAR